MPLCYRWLSTAITRKKHAKPESHKSKQSWRHCTKRKLRKKYACLSHAAHHLAGVLYSWCQCEQMRVSYRPYNGASLAPKHIPAFGTSAPTSLQQRIQPTDPQSTCLVKQSNNPDNQSDGIFRLSNTISLSCVAPWLQQSHILLVQVMRRASRTRPPYQQSCVEICTCWIPDKHMVLHVSVLLGCLIFVPLCCLLRYLPAGRL